MFDAYSIKLERTCRLLETAITSRTAILLLQPTSLFTEIDL